MSTVIEYKGTTKQCMDHFLHEFTWPEVQAFTAEFIGVSTQTVRSWYNGNNEPLGLGKIRMRIMLALLGYTVEEHARLSKLNERLARMLAFEVIQPVDVMSFTGHKNKEGVMRLVRENTLIEITKRMKAQQAIEDKKYDDQLEVRTNRAEMKVDKFLRTIQPIKSSNGKDDLSQDASEVAEQPLTEVVPSAPVVPVAVISPALVTPNEDDMLYALVSQVKAIASLVKVIEGLPNWQHTQRHYARLELSKHNATSDVIQFLEGIRTP